MRRYWMESYGCQMNKAEGEALERDLRGRGWRPAAEIDQAELVVVNTCSVRRTAEERIWGRLGYFKSRKGRHPFRLVLMGCMSERLKGEILERAPQVDVLIGNFQKHRLADLLEQDDGAAPAALTASGDYHFAELHSAGGFKAFLPIMHGCDNFCAYCIVPYVRGREVSRAPASILAEVRLLEEQGVREITLLGQNVNSYRHRGRRELDFPGLLRLIASEISTVRRLRFLTSHPKDLSQELIRTIAEEPALCRHIHLPVQHGSDRILAAMGRGYTRERYAGLVRAIRKVMPEASITTDILIGFPGEEEQDFRLTLELMEEVRFDEAFTYRYNPREGTRAFLLGDTVAEADKKSRLSRVIFLQREHTREARRRKVGATLEVLVEGVSKRTGRELLARTEFDEMVVFPAGRARAGDLVSLQITGTRGNTLVGKEA